MADPLQFFTAPVGRLVSGSVYEKRTKDQDNRPIDPEDQRYEFGVAFNKQEIWSLLAETWYPYLTQMLAADANGLARMQQWFQQPGVKGTFSMKVVDGDAPNSKGTVSENTKGCFVFYFSGIDPQTVGPSNEDLAPEAIKRGYYVQVAGNIKPNGQPGDRAGVYLNGNIVRLIGEGEEIRGGIDADTAFGGTAAPTALPPGAKPVGTSNGAAGSFTPPSVPGAAPAPAPTAPAAPGAAPGAPGGIASPTEPHTAILAGPPPLPGT